MAAPDSLLNIATILLPSQETVSLMTRRPINVPDVPIDLSLSEGGDPFVSFDNDSPDGIGWSTADYFLYHQVTYMGDPSKVVVTPVLGLLPDEDTKSDPPMYATIITSVLDHTLLYNPVTEMYHLWYFVYGWTANDQTNGDPNGDPPTPGNWFTTYQYDDSKALTFDPDNWWVIPSSDLSTGDPPDITLKGPSFPTYQHASLILLYTTGQRYVLSYEDEEEETQTQPWLVFGQPRIAKTIISYGDAASIDIVTPTSLTPDETTGYLPGRVKYFDPKSKAFRDGTACWIFSANN